MYCTLTGGGSVVGFSKKGNKKKYIMSSFYFCNFRRNRTYFVWRNLIVMTSTVDKGKICQVSHIVLMCKFEFLQCNATFRGDNSWSYVLNFNNMGVLSLSLPTGQEYFFKLIKDSPSSAEVTRMLARIDPKQPSSSWYVRIFLSAFSHRYSSVWTRAAWRA